MGVLSLPGLRLYFEATEEPVCVLVAGGRPPEPWWLKSVGADRCLWAVDAGADACRSASLIPHLVVGDLDSVSSRTLEWLTEYRVLLERHSRDKDKTDFQLALERWFLHPSRTLIVSGCWGGRFDHLWAVVHDCVRVRKAKPSFVCLADEQEAMVIMGDGDRGRILPDGGFPPSILSLLPLSDYVKGVTLEGVRWPLRDATLFREFSYTVSNQPLPLWVSERDKGVDVSLGEGWMGLYLAWEDVGDRIFEARRKNEEAGP